MARTFQPVADGRDAARGAAPRSPDDRLSGNGAWDERGFAHQGLAPQAGQEIDLRTVAAALSRRRRFVLLPGLAALVLVGIYVNVAAPRFTAQSQILLENQESFFTRPDRTASLSEAAQLDEIAVASQIQIITSHDLARRAIAKLKLVGNDEFDARPGPLTRLMQALRLAPERSREAVESRIVDSFEQKLVVFSPPKTRVVTVEFTSRDADLAARAANTVAELYIAEQAAAKRTQARTAADALSEQIANLRLKLAKADAERERYRSTSGLLAGTNNLTITGQQVADLNGDLSRARAVQADAQAKASTIRSLLRSGRAADVAEVTNNEIVRRIWDQRATAQAQLALESRTLLPGHPHVKELTAQVEGFDATLRAAAKQLAATLENEAQVAGARVANLEAALAQQKTAAGVANGDEVHLRALERVAQGYKDQLDSSVTKYEEALARQGSLATPADARIISRALPPQLPSFPKKLPFVAFATVATVVFTAGWVTAGELLSGRAVVGAGAPPAAVGTGERTETDGTEEATAAREADEGEPDDGEMAAEDPVFAPISSPPALPRRPLQPARPRSFGRRGAGLIAAARVLVAYARRFSQSAVQSARYPADPVLPASEVFGPSPAPTQPEIGRGNNERVASFFAMPPEPGRAALDALAQRIVAAHVPGRGMHIVGTGIGDDPDAADKLLALARGLSERGRALIVDLGTEPARLAALACVGRGERPREARPGLSELLAGDASFAEVIHRDRASRLHFVPTGALEADFRDFDLILDALSQTYDFILLLTPSYPRSEIARVMAPYADVVVLAATGASGAAALHALESEMIEAGAREVMVVDRYAPGREVA